MPGIHHTAIVTAAVDASMRFWRDGLGFTELFDYGFDDGVRRIEMPAPGGKKVAMAVITAPDSVRVELVGPPS